MPETLIDQMLRHEGMRLRPYEDTMGKLTIGVGRNLTDCGISKDEALVLLRHDLDQCVDDLRPFPWWGSLNDARRRALVDLRFNVGPARFRGFTKMLAALEGGDFQAAAREMLDSAWRRQVGGRAEELARMVGTGLLPESDTRSA